MESVASAQSASVALTIAGSDSGANAGMQAGLKTFTANSVYGTSAATCLTAQNPNGVTAIHSIPPETVVSQIEQIAAFHYPKSIKTHEGGCPLRAAITAWVSKSYSIQDSVSKGLNFIRSTMKNPVTIKGIRFINHFP